MEIEFKPLSADHLDQIKNFTDRWIGVGYFSENELDEAIRKGQKEDLNAGWVAWDQGRVVGVRITYAPGAWIESDSRISPQTWQIEPQKVAYFKSLFIDESYQKQGIGSRLSKRSIEVLKKMQAKAIITHAWVESPANSSRRYLSKMGFKEVNQHKNFWFNIDYECTRCGGDQRCVCSAAEMIYYL